MKKKKRKTYKGPFIVIFIAIIAIFGSLYLFKDYFLKSTDGPDDDIDIVEKKEKKYTTSLTFAGNVMLNNEMWHDASVESGVYDFKYIFEDLNDIMKKSDVNYYVQQSIVGGKELGETIYTNSNTPIELIDATSNVGFNLISLATFHAYDKKDDGIINTVKNLSEKDIKFSGVSANEEDRFKYSIITKNNIKIGLISYTTTPLNISESYLINIYDEEKVKEDIKELKKQADLIIVGIDWKEYSTSEVIESQRNIAKNLSDLGVNIIIGNNDNVIQPIEKINNTLVCYSLGNLLTGHSQIDSKISAIIDLKVTMTEKDKTITFDDINILLTYLNSQNSSNYKIKPFSKITTELNDYQIYYDKYSEILKNDDLKVKMYPIGE